MGVGDVPTWVAAVAAWAGVVVNALIVFVALAPIRNAKRERARARPGMLDYARTRLGVFTGYCKKLGFVSG